MTQSRPSVKTTLLVVVIGAALIGTGWGAAQYLRGPNRATGPDLGATQVVLADGRALQVQTHEVTVAQWQTCHAAGHCTLDLASADTMTDYPATGLSYPDAMEFIAWVNSIPGPTWRLPTAEEWQELAIEVMPETPDPIFTDPALSWATAYLLDAETTGRTLRPSGAFSTTAAGIGDLDGNVWEWTQDCYAGASGQGSTLDAERCPAFIMGGEHEAVMAYLIRDPARGGCAVGAPPAHLGMRLVSDPS